MSKTTRWVLGILWILAGLGLGFFGVFTGGIMTVGCRSTPPEYAYLLLVVGGIVTALSALVPAVMFIRAAGAKSVVIAFALGLILSCGLYVGYFLSLGGSC